MMLKKPLHLAIVGATGAVGQEILNVLERRAFPLASLRCFASERSKGQTIQFREETIPTEVLAPGCFSGVDIALFSAGKTVSLKYAPEAVREGALVVDNSSAFRKDPSVPLVIPEINPHALKQHNGIVSCPNCSTIIMLMALGPLHRAFKIQRVVAATYQAASGAGAVAMRELEMETRAVLEGKTFERTVIPHPYAFNLFPHNSPMTDNGYVEEELKMLDETRKILEDPSIWVNATCVRVPVLRAHAEALNVTFCNPVTVSQAYEVLSQVPGLTILENWKENRFAMPVDASGQDTVFCGRIREDLSFPQTLDLWVVGDQLLKGAALNAVQIAELLGTNTGI
jgi:aspartate-semialdehyde dehydrogenase